MTRVVFIPDDQTVVLLETALTAGELTRAVRRGAWRPPAPFNEAAGALRVVEEGRLVIILGGSAALPLAEQGHPLSAREREVMLGLVEGLSGKEIAQRMGLHRRTVDLHIARLKHRLGVATRGQIVARAAALGLCPAPRDER